jgi:hypothetical protein
MEALLAMDRELLRFLKKNGMNHPSVNDLLQQFSKLIPFPMAPKNLVKKLWEDHPEQVLREMEQRTLAMLMVPKGIRAQKIAEDLRSKLREGVAPETVAGEFGPEVIYRKRIDQKREDFLPELQDMVFKTPIGGVSEIVEGSGFLFVSKVDASTPGKADDFDSPGVKGAAEKAFTKQSRENWEKSYLERLQERIKEGALVEPAEAPNAE